MTTLKHPFPDEPWNWNAFAVLFGGDALRKSFDAQGAWGYVGPDVANELMEEMYALCAKHSGATVDEVKAFLRDPK